MGAFFAAAATSTHELKSQNRSLSLWRKAVVYAIWALLVFAAAGPPMAGGAAGIGSQWQKYHACYRSFWQHANPRYGD